MISDFSKKQKGRDYNFIFLSAITVGCILIFAGLIYGNVKIWQRRQALEKQLKNLQTKIEDLKKDNIAVEQGIASSEDKEYIEKIAREQLGLQKSGEKVIDFVNNKNQQTLDDDKEVVKSKNWLASLWNSIKYFFR